MIALITAAIIAFVSGFGFGAFFYHIYTNPFRRMRMKASEDIHIRLSKDGLPLNPANDYERHLYALGLKRDGKSMKEAGRALLKLGLTDVPMAKRARYIYEVLTSIIVGYNPEKLSEGGK